MVAFLVQVFVRAGPKAFSELTILANPRTEKIFEALLVVGAVKLFQTFRAAPWPDPDARKVKVFRSSAILAFAPFALMVFELFTAQRARLLLTTETRADFAAMMINGAFSAIGLGVPWIVLWLGIGIELKQPDGFSARRLGRHAVNGVGGLLREFLPLALIISGYAWMEGVIGQPEKTYDAAMAAADRAIFGRDPLDVLETWIRPGLSEWLAFSYSFYAFLYPLVLGAVLLGGGWRAARPAIFSVGAGLLIAYVFYSLIPVRGPMFAREFEVPLQIYWLREVKEALMDATRIPWDCFPSMHTCVTLLLGAAAFRHARPVFWACLPMIASIPFACVYLRYHYVVDVLAGIVLFIGLLWATRRFEKAGLFEVPAPAPAAK